MVPMHKRITAQTLKISRSRSRRCLKSCLRHTNAAACPSGRLKPTCPLPPLPIVTFRPKTSPSPQLPMLCCACIKHGQCLTWQKSEHFYCHQVSPHHDARVHMDASSPRAECLKSLSEPLEDVWKQWWTPHFFVHSYSQASRGPFRLWCEMRTCASWIQRRLSFKPALGMSRNDIWFLTLQYYIATSMCQFSH